jgi:hypothetical protein
MARPHLRSCLSCRATLREYRAAPGRVAALIPPAALVTGGADGGLRAFVESLAGAAHQATEVAAGQKVAAVAASAAALAGGGAAGVDGLAGNPDAVAKQEHSAPVSKPSEPSAPPVVTTPPAPEPAPAPAAATAPAPEPQALRKEPEAAREFAPDTSAPQPAPAGGEFTPSGSAASGGGGEFGP